MKIEELERYISTVRNQATTDAQIRHELLVGGWDAAIIDQALKNVSKKPEEIHMRVDETLEHYESHGFLSGFLIFFSVLLVVFNLISYAGILSGAESAVPVTPTDIIGGVIFSLIGGLLLGAVFSAMHRIRRSHPIFFSSGLVFFIILFIAVNLITFWGAITGSTTALPVTGIDIIGGFIMSVIGSVILAGLYIMFRRLFLKFKKE